MLQREVADRLRRRPGTGDYGAAGDPDRRWRADVDATAHAAAGRVPAGAEGQSAVVRLRFHAPVRRARDPATFEQLVRGIFTRRRKTLANALPAVSPTSAVDRAAALLEAPGWTAAVGPKRSRSRSCSPGATVSAPGRRRGPMLTSQYPRNCCLCYSFRRSCPPVEGSSGCPSGLRAMIRGRPPARFGLTYGTASRRGAP